MKTISRISAAVLTAILVLASCAKEDLLEGKATETVAAGTRVIAVSFSNSATKSELGTNGVTPKFVNGDKIMVSNGTDTEECTVNCKGDVASISPKLTGALTLVYPAAVWSDSEPYFAVPATQDGTFASANISTATIAAGAESALFEHQTAVLRFYVDASIGVKSFTVTSSTADIADGAKTITVDPDGDATLDTVTDDPGKRICYVAVLPTTSATDLTFTSVTTTQTACPASTVTRNVASVSLVKNRIYDAFVPYYIDLGANGKWGYCNVGAFLPEEYGDYFAWGETVGHKLNADKTATADGHSFDWSTAPFNGGASDYDAAYFTGHISEWLDGNDTDGYTLKLDYDAANANWGDSWRMPTHAEFMALNAITYKEWDSANKGYTFGASPAQIFLPAANICNGSTFINLGKSGYYMSSLLYPGAPDHDVVLYLTNPGGITTGYDRLRFYGQSIRPVYDAPYVPPVPEPLSGLFSVSPTKQVRFSPGNLWVDATNPAAPVYHFEKNQLDFRHFNGKSGDKAVINGTQTFTPQNTVGSFWWVKNNETSNIKPFDATLGTPAPANTESDILFTNNEAGTANPNFTVDGVKGIYRTLTSDEWNYLINSTDNDKRRGKTKYGVTVNGYAYCVVIAPDNWDTSAYPLQSAYSDSSTPMTWSQAQEAGLVCLPAAGVRNSTVRSISQEEHYWASNAVTSISVARLWVMGNSGSSTSQNRTDACCIRLVADVPSEPIVYVDLGLSVEWATCNLGATKPEEYGDYFAWGATEGYKPTGNTFSHSFNWTNAPFNNGSSNFNSDYFSSVRNTVCPDNLLASDYDAAHVIMGGTWRLPQYNEFDELLNNTNSSWTSDYNSTGVSGYVFTSKTDPSKSIFLPAGNRADGTALNDLNKYGCYWLAEQDQWDDSFAWYISFSNGYAGKTMDEHRYGMPIRPVRPKE